MKITFMSNFFNHHHGPLSDELYRITDKNYTFVPTEEMPEERKNLGYREREDKPYICDSADIKNVILDSDVLLVGSAPEAYTRYAINNNKLVFRYSERPLKKGFQPVKYIPRLIRWNWRNPFWKKVYLLSASAYAPGDYSKFGLFRKKAYRWGYFPETRVYEDIEKIINAKEKNTMLWAGRFIDWKHPDDAIEVAAKLKACGYDFTLNMIGAGEMQEELETLIKEKNLDENVHILGSMDPDDVRRYMEKSQIFLFTSDKQEGWGAVLNEAMNSGCAVAAGHEIGSVPYMIKDENNGSIYRSGNIEELFMKVKDLFDDPKKAGELGKEAYFTIINEWNAEIAAERLAELSRTLINGEDASKLYESGPCSPA